ncbi:TetR/AcrR family transcriptional regulator C-terminal domain-containing protein [Actinospica durhamensis]|uniref:TetR/AcrR family transcriptional regulator C-terminal domain-containing protein n=1 Tax=Actinospica durhamensis TaxID=1508375 RepID=A0A941EX39_9ACTN|nr:TetR/AcrR family transcriptional regulator C-terminal domain-containing protein [Actinospica durhamensis]MBR7838846.1 TetR/AcrR family transcriptional regulator C-terminal domain-containing protein [Actinospica durhamensis]
MDERGTAKKSSEPNTAGATDAAQVAGVKAAPRRAGATAPRRRATLTREAILEAALYLSSPEGGGSLTFARLGHRLGADPTAVYRHFRDKDELVLALTDVLIDEAVELAAREGHTSDEWRESLTAMAMSIRRVHLARPALAALCAVRTTASPSETESVERVIGLLHSAGLPVIDAAECYRMLLDLTLAFVQVAATWLMLDPAAQAKDDAAWAVKYGLLPAERFPLVHQSSTRLTELFRDDDKVFELVLGTFLDGVAHRIEEHRRG